MEWEVVRLLRGVLFSWEVWVATIVLALYVSLVLYVGRLNRRPRSFLMLEGRRKTKVPPVASPEVTEEGKLEEK